MKVDILPQRCKDTNATELLCYKGQLQTGMLVELGEQLREKLTGHGQLRNVFAVFIEMGQNLIEHAPAPHEILVEQSGDTLRLSSLNPIEPTRAVDLQERVRFLNSLNESELRRCKRERSRMPWETPGPSAGLGLYDMRLRSGLPLHCEIIEQSGDCHYCRLQATFILFHESN